MQQKKQFVSSMLAVLAVSFCFVTLSVFLGESAMGSSDGYGYNCNNNYGYGYSCRNEKKHKNGIVWEKYKYYKQRYGKKEDKKAFFKVLYFKKSKDPRLKNAFWEMRNIYLIHKFDKPEVFAKLDQMTQEKFKLYKKYHGENKRREYKKKAY